jgi:hypothetical protein
LASRCESCRKKIIGKPYPGKPNVRFDEGELEIERIRHYASSLLYRNNRALQIMGSYVISCR